MSLFSSYQKDGRGTVIPDLRLWRPGDRSHVTVSLPENTHHSLQVRSLSLWVRKRHQSLSNLMSERDSMLLTPIGLSLPEVVLLIDPDGINKTWSKSESFYLIPTPFTPTFRDPLSTSGSVTRSRCRENEVLLGLIRF